MENDFIKSGSFHESNRQTEEWKSCKTYVSKSALKAIKKSPAHYKYGEPYVDTPAKAEGRAYHCFVLQPEIFENIYYVFDDSEKCNSIGGAKPRGTNEYKKWFETQEALMAGKELIQKEDYNRFCAMKERLLSHQYARMLLTKGIAEQGLIGEIETEVGKIGIKWIPDYRKDEKHIIVELKTAADASEVGFTRATANDDYQIDAAFYTDLAEIMYNDNRPVRFVFIAQEKTKPYAFNLFEPSPQFLGQGRYEYTMLLQLYKYCIDNDKWPAYQCFCENRYGLLELNLPKYAIKSLTYYIY